MVHVLLRLTFVAVSYAVARQKLKQAEHESDLASNTENEDFRKKSRKNRAAKNLDTSTSSNNAELSDSIMSEIPKIQKISKKTTYEENRGCTNK